MIDIRKTELNISGLREIRQGTLSRKHIEVGPPGRVCDGFVFILKGRCHYAVQTGESLTAAAGDILYLSDKSVYSMDVDCAQYDFLVADFRFLSEEPRQCFTFTPRNTAETESRFRRMLHTYTSPDLARCSDCLSSLYRLYAQILRAQQSKPFREDLAENMEKARQYMDDNLQDPSLAVPALAERAEISEVYFRKLFRQMYGMSPVRYIILMRNETAKRLLRYTPMTLEEISGHTGYTSMSYFCKSFKEMTGLTPTQYRESEKSKRELT